MHSSHVKICGLTRDDAVKACVYYECGYIGFIAHKPSVRHVTPVQWRQLASVNRQKSQAVLVTCDASDAYLDEYIEFARPDILQLHGKESAGHCVSLKQRYELPIIKAIGVSSQDDIAASTDYEHGADILLFDTKRQNGTSGGTGKTFDWQLLHGIQNNLQPWFLSGGVSADNVQQAINTTGAKLVDVSSALEIQKGIKDIDRISAFMQQVKTL